MWKLFSEITIYGDPVATARARFDTARKIAYKPTKTRLAMNRRILVMKQKKREYGLSMIKDCAVRVEIDFYHKRPKRLQRKKDPENRIPKITKPDLDNLAKLILDCATQSGIWSDDNLITQLELRDWFCPKNENPKTVMTIFTQEEK